MGAGNLNLILDADVTSAAFGDNSSADWGTATLNITGAGSLDSAGRRGAEAQNGD